MQTQKSDKGITALDFLRRNPTMPTTTASRILIKQHPKLFNNLEAVRKIIQRLRGVNISGHTPDAQLADEWRNIQAEIAEPIPCDFSPVRFSHGVNNVLIISDAQIPFHEIIPLEAAATAGKREKVDGILINGDFWDCTEASYFVRDPRLRDITSEALAVRSTFAWLRSEFPHAEIIYKLGNHEERWHNKFLHHAPTIIALLTATGRGVENSKSIIGVAGLLGLDDFKIRTIETRNLVLLGKFLWCLHGHEMGGGAYNPISPARTVLLRTNACCLVSHFHQTAQQTMTVLGGDPLVAYSLGCSCNLHPRWRPVNNWNWGFALCRIGKDGGFRLTNNRVSPKGETW